MPLTSRFKKKGTQKKACVQRQRGPTLCGRVCVVWVRARTRASVYMRGRSRGPDLFS